MWRIGGYTCLFDGYMALFGGYPCRFDGNNFKRRIYLKFDGYIGPVNGYMERLGGYKVWPMTFRANIY